MSKVEFLRSLAFATLLCLLLWDALLWLTGPAHRLPGGQKQLLLTATLIWFALVVSGKTSDDDWAGEF